MTANEAFEKAKAEIIGNKDNITSVKDAEGFHITLIKLRVKLFEDYLWDMMPHYRGEQNFGWDIRCGIFRPPLNVVDAKTGKDLERKAVSEFETSIKNKLGEGIFRDLFNHENHGKEWDLLFQAQHAGIKTTLTDWTAEMISALYFATEESTVDAIEKADGQIWCFMTPVRWILGHNTFPLRETFYDLDPYNLQKTYLINVSSYLDNIQDRIFENRMYRQKGRFIMSSSDQCNIPLNKREDLKHLIIQLRVPVEYKKTIREELTERGITTEYMYINQDPDRQKLITDTNKVIFKDFH